MPPAWRGEDLDGTAQDGPRIEKKKKKNGEEKGIDDRSGTEAHRGAAIVSDFKGPGGIHTIAQFRVRR